ncbi:MAG: RNA 2',3'-cyclic phosphodiesterase [Actinomycetota bacterium]|nr:RNA 2',3'-cyclic phosphodiesterase [Actinomycetota bacterium]
MTRAFVAVHPPESVLDAVAARVESVELPEARRTARDQWHLTLQFLGNHVDIDAVAGALDGLSVAPGPARVGGAGTFPNPRRGRVLWLGIAEGTELLQELAAAVAARLAPLGYERDGRAYHPHLTLARCKTPADLRGAVAALGDAPVGDAWTVGGVVVYESVPARDGAQYTPRASITLSR